jgi:diadenosine tetraphosphatase ApaH/serine/threonine PP2A family protein phosphatase
MISAWPDIAVKKKLGVTLVHGSIYFDHAWQYVDSPFWADVEAANSPTKISFVGHTHRPFVFSSGQKKWFLHSTDDWRVLSSANNYVINVGSVGQPRDRETKAAYGILQLDGKKKKYQLRRVSYDVESAMRSIRDARLPDFFARRLELGR